MVGKKQGKPVSMLTTTSMIILFKKGKENVRNKAIK